MSKHNPKDIFFFYDIETSRIKPDQEGEKDLQVVYMGHLLGVDMTDYSIVYDSFHRHLHELKPMLMDISNSPLSDKGHIIVYIQNLNYEIQFLLREFKGNAIMEDGKTLFRHPTHPIRIHLDSLPNIEFRDSYALLSKSVKMLGDDLQKLRGEHLPKLDYNYTKTRLPWSDLEPLDYAYNRRDNEIVARSIYYFLKDNKVKPKNIPLTFTSNTKKLRSKFIRENFGSKGLASLNIEKQNSVFNYEFYKYMMMCYQGGLTNAVPKYMGKPIYSGVFSIDIKSSYPSQMVFNRFPNYKYGTTYLLKGENANTVYHKYLHNVPSKRLRLGGKATNKIKGYMGVVKLTNVKIKNNDYFLPLSLDHCINKRQIFANSNNTIINGKIQFAEMVILGVIDVDMEWLCKCYNIENIEFKSMYVTTDANYLKEAETSFILDSFTKKESIDKKVQPVEYALSKVVVNALYGIKCQKPIKDEITVIEGNIMNFKFDVLDDTDKTHEMFDDYVVYNESRTGLKYDDFDILTHGIYVTSYARLQLIDMMIKIVDVGADVIYCDTDSIKYTIKKECSKNRNTQGKLVSTIVSELVKEVNNEIIKRNLTNPRYLSYIQDFNINSCVQEKISKLGIWETENKVPYTYFKTFGAKKYAYVDEGKIHTVIAGCSTGVAKAIAKYCELNNKTVEEGLDEVFDVGTEFDRSCSGRTVLLKEKTKDRTHDYTELTYDGIPLNSYGGAIIENSTYLLDYSEADFNALFNSLIGYKNKNRIKRSINEKGELIIYDKVV